MCPFPGTGAPCVLSAGDNAPQNASTLAPSIEAVCPGVLSLQDLVCCDNKQLVQLQQQLDMAHGLLANCPACWANFRRFWCVFTCSPEQGSFVQVTESRVCNSALFPGPNIGPDGGPPQGAAGCDGTSSNDETIATVQALRLRVDAEYASDLFRSCVDVTVSATGQKAVDMAFGGARSAAEFFKFQGSTAYASGQNPLNIQVNFVNSSSYSSSFSSSARISEQAVGQVSQEEDLVGGGKRDVLSAAMREETVACHVEDAALGCLCNDCSTACPQAPPQLSSSVRMCFTHRKQKQNILVVIYYPCRKCL